MSVASSALRVRFERMARLVQMMRHVIGKLTLLRQHAPEPVPAPSSSVDRALIAAITCCLGAFFINWVRSAIRWLVVPFEQARLRNKRRDEEVAERTRWLKRMAEREKLVLGSTDHHVQLSVVIPAYNERMRLPHMLRECAAVLEREYTSYEVLVVDDGSNDNTAIVAEEAGAALFPAGRVRVARLTKNRGKGGAVREGALRARGDWILLCDADGATRFADLGRLWKAKEGVKTPTIVLGSRGHLVDTDVVARRSALRNLLMRAFHIFVSLVGGIKKIRDTQCGFKLLHSTALPALGGLHLERWAFDIEMLFIAQTLHFSLLEVDVQWTEIPGSKLNVLRDSLQMARDICCLRVAYAFGFWTLPSASHVDPMHNAIAPPASPPNSLRRPFDHAHVDDSRVLSKSGDRSTVECVKPEAQSEGSNEEAS